MSTYTVVNSEETIKHAAKMIADADKPIALDTETTGLFFLQDEIVGFSFAFDQEGEGFYVPVKHRESLNVPFDVAKQFFELLATKKLIFHNAKFDIEMVKSNFGIQLPVYADTMLMAYLLGKDKLALKVLIADEYGYVTKEFDDLLSEKFGKSWKGKHNISELTVEESSEYAINDVFYTYRLYNDFYELCKKFKGVMKIETEIIPVVAQTNMNGCFINKDHLRELSAKCTQEMEDLYKKMVSMCGHDFKVFSPKDVSEIFLNELKLPVLKRSPKTGNPSFDADVLEQLAELHEFPQLLVTYRSLHKFKSGYLDKIPDIVDVTGKLYSSFNSIGAVSGRFTCPGTVNSHNDDITVNMQNQPKSETLNVRKAFYAPEGWTFAKCDYKQIEYRVACNMAHEEEAIQKFKNGIDFHTATARMMLGIPEDVEPTHEERQLGKVLNFGLIYGMTVPTVAKKTNRSEAEAQEMYDKYFANLPRIKALSEQTREEVRVNKEVKTLFGRVRPLDWTQVPQKVAQDMIDKGFNTKIQGTAADILKIAICRVKHYVLNKWGKENVQLILFVHDEMDFLINNEHLEEILHDIKYAMDIPTPEDQCDYLADIGYGSDWDEDSHTEYNPEGFEMEKFTGWGSILPANMKSIYDDPDYVTNW